MTWWEIVIFAFALVFMLGGLLGTILPIIPGIPLIFAVALLYAFIDGFQTRSGKTIALFAVLTGVSLILDHLATLFGIKKMGGSYFGVLGAFIGMIVGFVVGNIVGLVIGSFAGAILFEMLIGKQSDQAVRAGFGSFIGFLVGGIIKFALAATMIGIFAWQVIWK